ncbi:IS1380 family transposase [Lentibacillus sp. CBA3610]|uniref:IS1380 family transposase n=1 Tax=Lentibacillus sp. CBA3610 TaxID=2518176 RepID=UPI001595760A|nr:IS1380 family transposase [Lentibacillus sp. CBA3610]QKY70152.1 IS1380 family transposase [Lentibacillus sp. CBA3610]
MTSVNETAMNFNKRVKVNFDGGDLTGDAGILLYQEFNDVIGLHKAVEEMVHIKDDITHRSHENHNVIMQKIYQIAAGYDADDHADNLKYDPVFTTALDKSELASQPTMSRLNQHLDKKTMKELQSVNRIIIDRFHELEAPEILVLDIDSSNSSTYGDQYGSSYNPHYGKNGYHPIFMFEGETGDCLKASLRAGNVYTSRQIVAFVGPELKRLRKKYPNIKIIIRGDSGFATPKLYDLCEELGADYVIRLKANQRLQRIAGEFENEILSEPEVDIYDGRHHEFYREFTYKAASWDKSRHVMLKLEKPVDQLFFIPTFIVTTLGDSPEDTVQFYAERGKMENYIKEGKLGFAFGQMSSTAFEINANKLQIAVLAYNLNNGLRRLCMPKKMKKHQIQTIRTKLIKIAGKVIRSGRYITFKLSSSSLYKNAFYSTLSRIQQLPMLC